MTTHPTDAELREALALAEKATPGPWSTFAFLSGPSHSLTLWQSAITNGEPLAGGQVEVTNSELQFIAAARTGWPAAVKALLETRAALRRFTNGMQQGKLIGTVDDWKSELAQGRAVLGEQP